MKNKVTAITEKVILPDGVYYGLWSGYVIKLTCDDRDYELTTEEGVRGINVRVIVVVRNGIATFEECEYTRNGFNHELRMRNQ